MTKKKVISATPKVTAEFIKLFGPPPLFNTEDSAIYNAILEGLAEDERPRSFIARILIRDVADLVYQRLWFGRLGPGLIQQAHESRLEVRTIVADVYREVEGENDSKTQEAFAKIRKMQAGPVDEASLFQMWIGNYEQLQSLVAAMDKKFSDTLKLLDEYRHGLGQRVHQITDEIVDAELEKGPLAAGEQQVATQSSSTAAVESPLPSTKAMSPALKSVGSPPEISTSSRSMLLRERRRVQPGNVQRRRRSAQSSLGRPRSNPLSSGKAEPGKLAELNQNKSRQ